MQVGNKNNIFKVCLTILMLFLPFVVEAQTATVTAKLDSNYIFIGQQTQLDLQIDVPQGVQVKFPSFKGDTIIKQIEIVERTAIDTVKNQDGLVLTQGYIITAFDTGAFYIPPIPVSIIEGQKTDTIKTEGKAFMVYNPFGEIDIKKGIADIKTPENTPFIIQEILDYIIYGLAILLVLAILIFLYKKYGYLLKGKKLPPSLPKAPSLPPHITALQELDLVKDSDLLTPESVRDYYTRIPNILRVYIEDRFGVDTLERTSYEILESLRKDTDIEKAVLDKIKQIFSVADLVKFAKYKPFSDDNSLTIVNAYFFVNQTKIEELKSVDELREEVNDKDETSPVIESKNEDSSADEDYISKYTGGFIDTKSSNLSEFNSDTNTESDDSDGDRD